MLKSRPVEEVERSLVSFQYRGWHCPNLEFQVEDTASPSFLATNLETLRRENPGDTEALDILKNAALEFYVGALQIRSLSNSKTDLGNSRSRNGMFDTFLVSSEKCWI